MNQHIEQAIDNFRRSAVRYAKTERYYRGDHDLAFATEKFENAFGTLFREIAMNLCPAICDAVKDKLRISGFGVNGMSDAFTRYSAELSASFGSDDGDDTSDITPKGVTRTVQAQLVLAMAQAPDALCETIVAGCEANTRRACSRWFDESCATPS